MEAANAAGGLDNVTVVILDIGEEGSRRTDAGHRRGATAPAAPAAPAPPAPAAPPHEPEPPPRPERARVPRRRRLLVRLLATAAVVAVALVGTRLYIDSQWFVGVSDGRVALFRGIPTEVLGYDLFSLVEETDLPADEAVQAALAWRDLPDGITASSEAEGREIIRQIERDLQAEVPAEVP